MALEYFPCYHSYGRKCEKLTDQELGRLFRALFKYSETGERQELAGRESIAFDFIADDIDRAKEAYEAKCEKNRANASERKRTQANDTQTSQAKDKSKSKTKEETKSKENTPPKSPQGDVSKRFTPPTLEEVTAYCQERGSTVNPKQFYDYFSEGGWVDSKGQKVRNWKQKILTWEKYQPKKQVSGREALEELWAEYSAEGSAEMGALPEWIDSQ